MRKCCLKVYVTDSDMRHIRVRADQAGLSVSDYLRRCGTQRKISSFVDRRSITDLMRINADLARLGNLFKLAITELSDETGDVARKLLGDAHYAMQEARGLQDKLRQKIMKVTG